MRVNASLAVEVNRPTWRRHVSGASFSCLVCATWTQVSGARNLGRRTWAVCHPPNTYDKYLLQRFNAVLLHDSLPAADCTD